MRDREKKRVDGTLSLLDFCSFWPNWNKTEMSLLFNHDFSVIVVIVSVVDILFRAMYSVLWTEITWATPWLCGLYPVPSHRAGEDFWSEE